MININLDTIRERDVDLAIIREFCINRVFSDLFAKQVGIGSDYQIESVSHSVIDADSGESDIEVMLNVDGKEVALLIEDKIDAYEQPQQYERYIERGERKKNIGEVTEYHIFMTAPKSYFATCNKYTNRITFEDMLDVITDDFDKAVVSKAIIKKYSRSKKGMNIQIVLARVKDRGRFDKRFKYNHQTLDFDNLEQCEIDETPNDWDDAHRRLWDYIKQLRGRNYKRAVPDKFLVYFNTNIKYNTQNSQFIESDGYDDVAWVDCGSDIYVMYRVAKPKEA